MLDMKIKLIVDDMPLNKVSNFCIENNLELDIDDMSIILVEVKNEKEKL